jgi:hypothetical protein
MSFALWSGSHYMAPTGLRVKRGIFAFCLLISPPGGDALMSTGGDALMSTGGAVQVDFRDVI